MKVRSKFDSTEIGEVEDIKLSELKTEHSSDSRLTPSRLIETMISVLEKFSASDERISILSMETGRTKLSCKEELLRTVQLMKYNYAPRLIEILGSERVRTDQFRKITAVVPDISIPVYTMFVGIVESIINGTKPMILHNSQCPISTMTLSNDIYEYLRETSEYILDVAEENSIRAFDKWGEGERILFYGNTKDFIDVQKAVTKNNVIWKQFENGVSIVPDSSHMEMATNSVPGISYLSVSNRFLRSQLFLISDKEYIFFKNRIIEFLKRDVKKGYGPEGDINYFNTQEDAEMARQSVRKLLENDFDYVDGLHESVHLLENRYGEKIVPMEQIPGPVIVLYHFKNLKDAIVKAMSVKNCNFINIFTDSFNAVDFAKSRTGIEILRNVESSRALLV